MNLGKAADTDQYNAYGYESNILTLCSECANEETVNGVPFHEWRESRYNEDDEPRGIYSYDLPETDSPIHCESCGNLIASQLTVEGMGYVKQIIAEHGPCAELYQKEFWIDG